MAVFQEAKDIKVAVIGYGGAFNMARVHLNEMKQAGLKVTHQEVRWGEIWAEAKPTPKVRGRTRE